MSNVVAHPSTAEFAARLNAETITQIQREHAAEKATLHARIRDLEKQEKLLKTACHEMQEALVEIDGKRVTLWSVYESGRFEQLCTTCRDTDCHGCPTSAAADRSDYRAEVER